MDSGIDIRSPSDYFHFTHLNTLSSIKSQNLYLYLHQSSDVIFVPSAQITRHQSCLQHTYSLFSQPMLAKKLLAQLPKALLSVDSPTSRLLHQILAMQAYPSMLQGHCAHRPRFSTLQFQQSVPTGIGSTSGTGNL